MLQRYLHFCHQHWVSPGSRLAAQLWSSPLNVVCSADRGAIRGLRMRSPYRGRKCLLTYCNQNKMAAVCWRYFQMRSLKMLVFWVMFHGSLSPGKPVDNKSVPVGVMAWWRTGNKPLFEPTIARFIGTYMRHQGISNFIPHFIMDAIVYPCWD